MGEKIALPNVEEGKTIKVETRENSTDNVQKKLSYDELNTIAAQATQQNRMLAQQLQRVQNDLTIKRLELLFKVLDIKDAFPTEFTQKAAMEIIDLLTIPEQEDLPDELDSAVKN